MLKPFVIATLLVVNLASTLAEAAEFDVAGNRFATFGPAVEAYGKTITATVAGTPAGSYTVEVEAEDYRMADRTYRFCEKKPLWAFGHGLSYTRFAYSKAEAGVDSRAAAIRFTVTVENTGGRDGDEAKQDYIVLPGAYLLEAGPASDCLPVQVPVTL